MTIRPDQTLDDLLPGGETLEVPPGVLPCKERKLLHMMIGGLVLTLLGLFVVVVFFGVIGNKEVVASPAPIPQEVKQPKAVVVETPAPKIVAPAPVPRKEKTKEFLTLKIYLDQKEAGMNFTLFKKEFSVKKNLNFIHDWAKQAKEVVSISEK